MFSAGQTFGNYTLIRPIGRGGFGEVWLAERRSKFVTMEVAIKLPLSSDVDHDLIRREAELWQLASGHPNVLPLIDADEIDGQVVIVSEYMPDGSLEQLLKDQGPFTPKNAVELMIGILEGLAYLHGKNIVHRDVKPANILMNGMTPRLTDFGISRTIKATVNSASTNISGTFAYMPPEAFDGKRTIQSDIWSCGVMLHKLLTGTLPFPETDTTQVVGAILTKDPEPLPEGLPPFLQATISRALRKNPLERYGTASEMLADLSSGRTSVNIASQATPQTGGATENTNAIERNLIGQFDPEETVVTNSNRSASGTQRSDKTEGQEDGGRSFFNFPETWITLAITALIAGVALLGNLGKNTESSSSNQYKVQSNVSANATPSPTPTPTPDMDQLKAIAKSTRQNVLASIKSEERRNSGSASNWIPSGTPKRVMGDLNGDGVKDAAELFCFAISESDVGACFMAVFINSDGKFAHVGTTGSKDDPGFLDSLSIVDKKILVKGFAFTEGDDVSPSKKVTLTFEVRNGTLARVK